MSKTTNSLTDTAASKGAVRFKNALTHYAEKGYVLELYRDDDGKYSFALRSPGGRIQLRVKSARIGGVHVELAEDSFVTGGVVVLPPQPADTPQETSVLLGDLLDFLPQHVTWSREFMVGAAAYVMATWVYERFQFFPYLQFIGPPGSGKTRSLDALASVCYHACKQSSPTAPILYRVVSKYHPTLLIDEVDSSVRSDLRNILREGSGRGGKVLRCRADNFEPQSYSCFGPKVYGGQEPITDAALASRMIQENMTLVSPAAHIGPSLSDGFESQAHNLRARLLRWELDHFWTLKLHDPGGKDARQRQLFQALFTVAPEKFHCDLHRLMERHHQAARKAMVDTPDGEIVIALKDMDSPEIVRPIDVARVVSEARGVNFDDDLHNPERVSAEKVGRALRRLGITDCGRDDKGKLYRVQRAVLDRLYETYVPEPMAAETEKATGSSGGS